MNETSSANSRPRRGWVYAVILFFVVPLVGEFLLGNLPITWLWVLLVLAPLYGGGALLIREAVRRLGLGWPGMFLLALAYAVVEEAFVTQSLFNPDYLGLRLLDYGYIPALGMSSWWTVFVLGIHVIWSIATPIALVEALSGPQAREPWLGRIGLGLTVVVFALGCLATTAQQLQQDPFRATEVQFVGAAIVVVALVIAALAAGRRAWLTRRTHHEAVPAARTLVAAGFVVGSLFMTIAAIVHQRLPAGVNVGLLLALLAVGAFLLLRWSGSTRWTPASETAFASGVLLTYVWFGFHQVPSVGVVPEWVDVLGNIVFSAGALLLLARAWKAPGRER